MELLFAERIRQKRLERGLTQEQLAQDIRISPQSVSKWERGDGYPDITLLPRIANYFRISVDELIGNDEATRQEEVYEFQRKFDAIPWNSEGWPQKLALAKECYDKYPQNYDVMYHLENAIVNNMDSIETNLPLLREIHAKIMSGCTDENYRRDSIHRMCYVASDSELEDQIGKSELNWAEAVTIGELREERFLLQHRFDEYRRERNATDLLIFMQYLGRNNMAYFGLDCDYTFAEPARTAAWELHKLRILEQFDDRCIEENGIPEAWCGCYAEFSLKAAGALIGCGRIDEGFERLDQTFDLYERWNRIPPNKQMRIGNPAVFGEVYVNKDGPNNTVYITFADGHTVWTPYLWLFWQLKSDISCALTKWPWFDSVKEDPRYKDALARAVAMAETDYGG